MSVVARLRRGLSAALAAIALTSATARPLLACEMVMDAPAQAAESTPSADPHAHHGAHGLATESASDAPGDDTLPTMPGCDHLIGCTVMVASDDTRVMDQTRAVLESAPRFVATHLDAPVRAVEPPPPRA